jgi:hypothetical protein
VPISQSDLVVVIEAQDRASQQLQQVGQQVQRLQQQVEQVGQAGSRAGGGGGLLGGLLQGVNVASGMRALDAVFGAIQGTFGLVQDSIFGLNSRLEQATATFRVFTGSAVQAQAIVQALQHEADITPFDTDEMVRSGAALIGVVHGDQAALLDLLHTVEALAAFKPEQGLEGAAQAVREALGGNLQSLRERFEVDTSAIEQLERRGVPALQAVGQGLRQVGIDSRLVDALAQTFPGLLSNVTSFADQLRQRLGSGLFDEAKVALEHLNDLIGRYGAQVEEWASTVGAFLGLVAERLAQVVAAPLLGLLNTIAPGAGDLLRQVFAEPVQAATQLHDAVQQTTAAVQQYTQALSLAEAQEAFAAARDNAQALNTLLAQTDLPLKQNARSLAEVGLAAAEVQQQASRVQAAYDAQLLPLQRQQALLEHNAELQGLQSRLASTQAQQERDRLVLERAALLQAAQGATDPTAPDLSPRQRAIALALQERDTRLRILDLQQQQRPILDDLAQRQQALEQQRDAALQPFKDRLAALADERDTLSLVADRWNVLRATIQLAIDTAKGGAGAFGPPTADEGAFTAAGADAKARARQLADDFNTALQTWLDAGGGTAWGALTKTLADWYESTGKPHLQQFGTDVGDALGEAIGKAVGPAVLATLPPWLRGAIEGAGQGGQVGSANGPLGTAAGVVGGAALGAGGLPVLPRVTVPPGGSGGGGSAFTVNVDVGDVSGGLTPEEVQRIAQQKAQELAEQLALAAAGTDPGPNRLVQGAGR